MTSDDKRVLPRDAPQYHERQAAHLRALAEQATTRRIKQRLLDQAAEHEQAARPGEEPVVSEPEHSSS